MKQKNGKKTFWSIILILSLIGLIVALLAVGWHLYQGYLADQEAKRLAEQVVTTEAETEAEPEETVEGKEGDAAVVPEVFGKAENPIDFAQLAEINPEIYAWITIEDTNINYPICQREGDNEFYLHHDMYQQERFAGSIYTEDCNSKDFSDPNTVIYGHNMKNKSMFQNLHKYEDYDFFVKHPTVMIYTPDKVRTYQVFAAYKYDDRHLMRYFDFADPEVFSEYLKDVQRGISMEANLNKELTVTETDRIITLSTCVGTGGSERYLVQAVLISEEES